jgi:hypothetical protein
VFEMASEYQDFLKEKAEDGKDLIDKEIAWAVGQKINEMDDVEYKHAITLDAISEMSIADLCDLVGYITPSLQGVTDESCYKVVYSRIAASIYKHVKIQVIEDYDALRVGYKFDKESAHNEM